MSDTPSPQAFLPGPKPAVLMVLYLAIVALPVVASRLVDGIAGDWAHELGNGAGMLATTMLLVQFISSGRYESLSGKTGIDRTMHFHQVTARLLMALALMHPLLLVAPTAFDELPMAMSMLQSLALLPTMRTGVVALVLLALLVSLGIWRHRLPVGYEVWRLSHVAGALIVASAGVHHALSVGTYSQGRAMAWLWTGMLVLASGTVVWTYGLKPLRLARSRYEVIGNDEVAPGIRELRLLPADGRSLAFRAGQFAWLDFGARAIPWRDHPFSIASAPSEAPMLRFLIKARGDFTRSLAALTPGTAAHVDAPHGSFTPDGHAWKALVLIAGGIGIAPIAGILRELDHRDERRPLRLIYAVNQETEAILKDEISAIAGRLPLSVHFHADSTFPSDTAAYAALGQAFAASLERLEPAATLVMFCGPTPMLRALQRCLADAQWPAQALVYERFDYD
ncbi:MAG: ferredoxin reductase family protein [Burkholderiales bacterium]